MSAFSIAGAVLEFHILELPENFHANRPFIISLVNHGDIVFLGRFCGNHGHKSRPKIVYEKPDYISLGRL